MLMLMLRKICSFCSSFFDSSFCAPFQNYVIPTMIPTMIPTLTRARLIPSILSSQSSNIVQMDGWMDGWMDVPGVCTVLPYCYEGICRSSLPHSTQRRSLLLEKIAGGGLKEGEMLLLSWPPPKRKIEGFQESLQAI